MPGPERPVATKERQERVCRGAAKLGPIRAAPESDARPLIRREAREIKLPLAFGIDSGHHHTTVITSVEVPPGDREVFEGATAMYHP